MITTSHLWRPGFQNLSKTDALSLKDSSNDTFFLTNRSFNPVRCHQLNFIIRYHQIICYTPVSVWDIHPLHNIIYLYMSYMYSRSLKLWQSSPHSGNVRLKNYRALICCLWCEKQIIRCLCGATTGATHTGLRSHHWRTRTVEKNPT